MFNANKPDLAELPSSMRLLRSTLIAAVTAIVILVAVVLPAEYGADPTRIGSLFGLTEMGRIKQQLASEASADAAADASAPVAADVVAAGAAANELVAADVVSAAAAVWRDEVLFTLAADAAAEYKLVMKQGETAEFVWFTDGARVNYDTHGDRPGVSYHGYDKGSVERLEGSLTAAFEGNHGWYWRNRSGAPLTVTLRMRGAYAELKRAL